MDSVYDFTHSILTTEEERQLLLRKSSLQRKMKASDLSLDQRLLVENMVYGKEIDPRFVVSPLPPLEDTYRQLYSEYRQILNALVAKNMRFVSFIAAKYSNGNKALHDEYVHVGAMGLAGAIERTDVRKHKNKLGAYAFFYIRSAIQKKSHRGSSIKFSKLIREKILEARSDYYSQYESEPTVEELHELTGIKPHLIRVYFGITNIKSLDEPITEDGAILQDVLPDRHARMPWEDVAYGDRMSRIEEFMEVLTERERDIINLRFGLQGEKLSLADVGVKLGRTRERIRQIEGKALRKLRKRVAQTRAFTNEVCELDTI